MMNVPFGIVYCATHKESGKKYIGSTKNGLEQRKKDHKWGKKSNFSKFIKENGCAEFEWAVLAKCSNYQQMRRKEDDFIIKFDTINTGFNERLNCSGSGYQVLKLPNRIIECLDKDAKRKKITRSETLYLVLCKEYGFPGESS
jgi:predicted GIY-YIG superfamily endonuclease